MRKNKKTFDEIWESGIDSYRKAFFSLPAAAENDEIADDVILSVSYKLFRSGKDEVEIKRMMRDNCRKKVIDIWRKKKNEPAIESLVEELATEERREDEYERLEEILSGLPEATKEIARALATGNKKKEISESFGFSDRALRDHQKIIRDYLLRTKDFFYLDI